MSAFDEIMACNSMNKEYFNDLSMLVQRNRIVPFIGAGMSLPIYKTWGNALREMVNGYADAYMVDDFINNNQFEEAASAAMRILGKTGFENAFETLFSMNKLSGNKVPFSKSAQLLPELFSDLLVTMNFDHVLETIYNQNNKSFVYTLAPRTHKSAKELANSAMREGQHFLIKLHGDIADPNSRVLTKDEYDDIYGELSEVQKEISDYKFKECSYLEMLSMLFSNIPFLFLSCSLMSDRTLDLLHLQASSHRIKNYAFMELPSISNEREQEAFDERKRFLSNQSILVIWYPHGKHVESIFELLKKLIEIKKNESQTNEPNEGFSRHL